MIKQVTLDEAAEALHVNSATVREFARLGRIKEHAHTEGGTPLFLLQDMLVLRDLREQERWNAATLCPVPVIGKR